MKKIVSFIIAITLCCCLFLSSCASEDNVSDRVKDKNTSTKKETLNSSQDRQEQLCEHKYIKGVCKKCGCSLWDGTIDVSWYSVLSTELTIDTAAEFAGFSQLVNSGTDFHDVTITLNTDIDLNNIEWTPIALDKDFLGTFDGANHSISNMKITSSNKPLINTDKSYSGLFAKNNGTLLNLGIVNIIIDISDNALVYAGGITAFNTGVIKNCGTMGTINIISLEKSFYVGGLVGFNNVGTIEKCNASIEIFAKSEGKVTQSCMAGGFVGENCGGIITKSYSTGHIRVQTDEIINGGECNVGGFAGTNIQKDGGIMGTNSLAVIKNCYSSGNVSASLHGNNGTKGVIRCGGFVGKLNKGTIENCYALGSANAECYDYEMIVAYADCFIGDFYLLLDGNTIKNCFGIGNVSATIGNNYTYGSAYASAFSGSSKNILNCYYNKDMLQVSSTDDVEKSGTPADISDFKTIEMFTKRLKWDEKIWIFSVGKYPTLR